MDNEDYPSFMPPSCNTSNYKYCEIICPTCKQSILVEIDNRPSSLCLITGIELDFLPDKNGPLIVIQCPHCKMNMISVRKSRKINCKFCSSIQELKEDYKYQINLENNEYLKDICNGSLNVQSCSNCNGKNYHQFAIEIGLMRYKLIRSINPQCRTREDYLENARTWFWTKKYDLSYEAFKKGEIELLSAENKTDKVFSDYILMACVLEKLEKRDEMPYWFHKALDIKPDDPFALKALGYSYFNLKKCDEAIGPFEKIVKEKICVSDMFVDNVNFKLEVLMSLVVINHNAGNRKKTRYWEKEKKKLISKYPFLLR